MPSPRQERQRILHELEDTFRDQALNPNLPGLIEKTCGRAYGLSRKVSREYAETVTARLQYNAKKNAQNRHSQETSP